MSDFGSPRARIPVHIITGFLGSGKTTLLRRLLSEPGFADTAVLINEFGEVGLDHLIAREVSEDVLLLDSGCLCCSAGEDLASTLFDLLDLRQAGEAAFDRVVIETSGLADPGPMVELIMANGAISSRFRMGRVITAVDGINGGETIEKYREAQQQLGLSDAAIITKEDIVPLDHLTALRARIAGHNEIVKFIVREDVCPYLSSNADRSFHNSHTHHAHEHHGHAQPHSHHHHHESHTQGVSSFVVRPKGDIDIERFVRWLELLLQARGKSILRVKGLLKVAGEDRPRVLQAVQTMVYPLTSLDRWPDDQHETTIVFIGSDISRSAIERSLCEHGIGCDRP